MAALNGAVLSQRVFSHPSYEGGGCGGDAEGNSGSHQDESHEVATAARTVEDGIAETLTYIEFPREHWRKIRTNNPMESVMREILRRTRAVGNFPDGNLALMLVTARLRYVAGRR